MVKTLKDLFVSTALVGFTVLPAYSFAQDVSPVTPSVPASAAAKKMTVRDASILIQNANRAADNLAMAGIVSSISSTGKVTSGTATLDVGLTQASCDKLKDQGAIPNIETYKAAQKVMIDSGHLTAERAAQNLKTQMDFLKMVEATAPTVAKACADLGVKDILGYHPH